MSSNPQVEQTMEAIMQATYRALCEHGYANISISKIADEFEKSRGLLYYHYESKEEILTDFLSYILEQIEKDLNESSELEAHERLIELINQFTPPDLTEEEIQFRQAYCEMRAQAPSNREYQRLLTATDNRIQQEIEAVINDGIESGKFQSVDPEASADFIFSAAYGSMERGVIFADQALLERNRQQLLSYIENYLIENR